MLFINWFFTLARSERTLTAYSSSSKTIFKKNYVKNVKSDLLRLINTYTQKVPVLSNILMNESSSILERQQRKQQMHNL